LVIRRLEDFKIIYEGKRALPQGAPAPSTVRPMRDGLGADTAVARIRAASPDAEKMPHIQSVERRDGRSSEYTRPSDVLAASCDQS
jgi:hypothetical protein